MTDSPQNTAIARLTTDSFVGHVQRCLDSQAPVSFDFDLANVEKAVSAVFFLLGPGDNGEPVLILNKRSDRVRQPGDLCCPGGGVSSRWDHLLSRGVRLPFFGPLQHWRRRQQHRYGPKTWMRMTLLLATALREGFEEMRLNPMGVQFLGPMAPQDLVMFQRAIYPLVGWVQRQRRFRPNWEVDQIVRIPVAQLLDDRRYRCCRITMANGNSREHDLDYGPMPGFLHLHNGTEELLWGATYRLVEQFLALAFDYHPPELQHLAVVERRLDRRYLGHG